MVFLEMAKFLKFWEKNWYDYMIAGVIMVSAITVFIGILKPLLFNKIKWKPLRRACLAFSNVGLCFGSTAIWFWTESMNFGMYLQTAILVSAFSIIWYWLYENTCLRDLIEKIGKLALGKASLIFTKLFNGNDIKEIGEEIKLVSEELKKTTKKEIKAKTASVKTDNELKDL